MRKYFLVLILWATPTVFCEQNFTGHKLIGAFPSSESEVSILRQLRNNTDVDFWNEPVHLYEKVNLRLSAEIVGEVEEQLKESGIDFYVITNNLQEWVDRELQQNPPDAGFMMAKAPENFRLDVYHRLEEINAYIEELGKKSDKITVMSIGSTHQGNSIKGVKIGNPGSNKPAIWIDAGIHSREWVAPATALYILDHFWKRSQDTRIKRMLDTFDWYIFPVMNPDGYQYTWTGDRMWRKNRVISGSRFFQTCYGVDPNRNFNAKFGQEGTSSNPCSDIYPGSAPFSELESRAMRDAILPLKGRLKGYFSFHSYSQLWMCPYGYTRTFSADYVDLMAALQKATNAIVGKHGEWYRYGTIANTIYPASGSSTDWAYDVVGVKYAFAVELRDRGQHGFLLPRNLIKPTSEETLEGVLAIAEHIIQEM